MAFVFGVISPASLLTSMFIEVSASTTTGVVPDLAICITQEMIVNVGMMTSSPGPIPRASTAMSIAAVPLATATACLRPTYAAISSSKRLTYEPSDETQPVSMQSSRNLRSSPRKMGVLTGMKSTGLSAAGRL